MSKFNIEKAIEKILSNEQCLQDFLACGDLEEIYECCSGKSSEYTREEFNEFVEGIVAKAEKEIDQSFSRTDKKVGKVFSRVLAASLAVFSIIPMVQNFIPQVKAENGALEALLESSDKDSTIKETKENSDDGSDSILLNENGEPVSENEEISGSENKNSIINRQKKMITGLTISTSILGAGVVIGGLYQLFKWQKWFGLGSSKGAAEAFIISAFESEASVNSKLGNVLEILDMGNFKQAVANENFGFCKDLSALAEISVSQKEFFIDLCYKSQVLGQIFRGMKHFLSSMSGTNKITVFQANYSKNLKFVKEFSDKIGRLDGVAVLEKVLTIPESGDITVSKAIEINNEVVNFFDSVETKICAVEEITVEKMKVFFHTTA
ncbi:MAG: hypothetical protein LBJ32_00175 [Oscillospiraceae bacterium]|jgi:hypothetical protein|nr:hypothetical protein [Oscillospiraceae bacterium]